MGDEETQPGRKAVATNSRPAFHLRFDPGQSDNDPEISAARRERAGSNPAGATVGHQASPCARLLLQRRHHARVVKGADLRALFFIFSTSWLVSAHPCTVWQRRGWRRGVEGAMRAGGVQNAANCTCYQALLPARITAALHFQYLPMPPPVGDTSGERSTAAAAPATQRPSATWPRRCPRSRVAVVAGTR